MKKLGLFFVMFIMLFTSCLKDETLDQDQIVQTLDTESIRAQLVDLPILTKEQVEAAIAGPKLKGGVVPTTSPVPVADLSLIEIVDLDAKTYIITKDIATKNMLYLDINKDGNCMKTITITQTFKVKYGQVDASSYAIDYEIGCPYSRNFRLDKTNNLSGVTYFFRFNSGKQMVYYGNSGNIYLAPIAFGRWQLQADYWDGQRNQKYATDYVNFYGQSDIINIRLDLGTKNKVSTVVFNKSVIIGAYNIELRGFDKNGVSRYMSYLVMYDKELTTKIFFDAPFDVREVYINGIYTSNYYETKYANVITHNADGTMTYEF